MTRSIACWRPRTPLCSCALAIGLAACTSAPRRVHDLGAVVRGDVDRPELALIFTGGDYGEGSEHVLDVLGEAGVEASFFLTGAYLAETGQRELVRRMVREGHYVGPHSDAHLLYSPWDDRSRSLVDEECFRLDLERNIADLRALGALPAGSPIYFVPPFEWFNADHVRWAREIGVTLVNFSPGSGSNRDYVPEGQRGFVPSETILEDVLEYERRDPQGLNGFLLLLHLGSGRRDKMHLRLESLLAELQARGYRTLRIDELLAE